MKKIHVISELIESFNNAADRCERQPIYNRAGRNALPHGISAAVAIRVLNGSESSLAPIGLRVAMEVISSIRTGESDELPFYRALCKALRQVVGALMHKQHELLIEEFVRRGLPIPEGKKNIQLIEMLGAATYESRRAERARAESGRSRHLWHTLESALAFVGQDPTLYVWAFSEHVFAAIFAGEAEHRSLLLECRTLHQHRARGRADLAPSQDLSVPELASLKQQLATLPLTQKPKVVVQTLAKVNVAA